MATPGNGMLPDGSNPEGVDPVPALEWTKESLMTGDAKFYGVSASPPCNKIRTYLYHTKIPFTFEIGMNKPNSDYKKMPVFEAAGRQVNDSYIIIKNLIPACMPEATFDAAFEEQMAFSLQLSLESIMSRDEIGNWAWNSPHGFGIPGCVRCCMEGTVESTVRGNILKAADKDVNPHTADKVKLLKEPEVIALLKPLAESMLASESKFFDGAAPGQKDLSVYGTIVGFLYMKIESTERVVKESGLEAWVATMKEVVPMEKLFPAEGFTAGQKIVY